jgi:DeoR/GlpR family transcriptional regulator of sugar metabolism
MLGGRLFRHSMVNVGAAVIGEAARLRADLYFMGVTGVHPEEGLTTGDAEEAAVKRALHERAAETIVLASGEKLLAASAFMVAPLAEASLVAVPHATPERLVRALRTGGVKIRRAP